MARRSGDKYRAIIEAAVKVIAENGYHNAQVSKIAREAGVADGTIYLYFRNKEDVLISLFRVKMGEFIAAAKKELEGCTGAKEQLARLIRLHFTRLEANRHLATVMQIQLRQSDPVIRQGITEPLRAYSRLIEGIVSRGMETGEFRPDLDVRLARQMIFGTMDEVATCWVMSHRHYSLVALAPEVYRLLFRALAAKDNGSS
ncbi:transcriptional regulator, TetR family [Desulfofundulus australicus DSM 11792]|uniref:Transcriptional regulator, TetR family n=1 Tax=Desulfofundulus australicus DSM 11792 TaxID=1121425 RepID=A0A1M4S830_9FIRM|nr:TetR/AcrR family transcriptional regulator [Desulfofundulus australicus]SHE28366.1 transcriptional regulator, TetR family [Desulfofundulus australicus DSM 11792]